MARAVLIWKLITLAPTAVLCSFVCPMVPAQSKPAVHKIPAPLKDTVPSSKEAEASFSDTIDFIKGKLIGSRFRWQEHIKNSQMTMTASYDGVEADGSALTVKGTTAYLMIDDASHDQSLTDIHMTFVFDLKQLSLQSSKVIVYSSTPQVAGLKLYFNSPQSVREVDTSSFGAQFNTDTKLSQNSFELMLETKEVADRVLHAMEHAAKLSGAKKEAF